MIELKGEITITTLCLKYLAMLQKLLIFHIHFVKSLVYHLQSALSIHKNLGGFSQEYETCLDLHESLSIGVVGASLTIALAKGP